MFYDLNERVREIGLFVTRTGATVRAAAEEFGVSKSTVHKDLTERLRFVDGGLFETAKLVLTRNRAERHLRGGLATKRKYKKVDNR